MTYSNYQTENYQLVSVLLPAAQQRYYFPDLPNLREVFTYGICAYTRTLFQYDNNGVSQDDRYNRVYVTLVNSGEEVIQKMDLISMVSISADAGWGSNNGLFMIGGQKIQYNKSYIEYGFGTSPSAYPSVLTFGVYYSRKNFTTPKPKMG